MKRIIAGIAVALAIGSGTAAADGIDKKYTPIAVPPPIYVPTWSGFYIGAGIGAGVVQHDVSVRDTFFDETLFGFNHSESGVLGTVIVGWDWQLGPKTVFGVFVDYDFFDLSTRHSFFDLYDHSVGHDNAWSVGARLGMLTSPSTLLYLTGGYTQLQVDHRASLFGLDILTAHRDRTVDGWFVGAGIDTRLGASNWFLRLEYRFSEFDNGSLNITDGDDIDIRFRDDLEAHSARLTLTYKFTPGPAWGTWGR